RIAVTYKALDGKTLHPDVVAAVKKTAKLCEDLGHIVEEVTPPLNGAVLTPAFMTVWAANAAFGLEQLAKLTGTPPSTKVVEGLTLGLYRAGKKVSAVELMAAKQAMTMASRTMAQFHDTYDVWLNATLGAPPIRLGVIDIDEEDPNKAFAPIFGYVPFTAMQNATGQPAIQLPLNVNKAGLPIGVQFVARYGGEMTLLKLAVELEKAAPWAGRRPNLKAR
ncbi:MAG: amidase, partial [Alphaproteobacteria bacterium]|nr:amidase [Alphaproteobacteria bacterium]